MGDGGGESVGYCERWQEGGFFFLGGMDSVGEGGNVFFGGVVRVKEVGGGRGCVVVGGVGGGCSGWCN